MMDFISILAQDCQGGHIASPQVLARKVLEFFTPGMLDTGDAIAPGWRKMSPFADGATLIHVTTALTGL